MHSRMSYDCGPQLVYVCYLQLKDLARARFINITWRVYDIVNTCLRKECTNSRYVGLNPWLIDSISLYKFLKIYGDLRVACCQLEERFAGGVCTTGLVSSSTTVRPGRVQSLPRNKWILLSTDSVFCCIVGAVLIIGVRRISEWGVQSLRRCRRRAPPDGFFLFQNGVFWCILTRRQGDKKQSFPFDFLHGLYSVSRKKAAPM